MAVQISTEIYKKGSVYYKDQACNSPFSDQKAAKVLWRQKYGASFGESLVGVAKLVGFLLLLSGAINLWEFSAREGWRSHDELITVDGRNWANGEYKDCSSLNPKNTGLTYLNCSEIGGEAKDFMVRFYGPTYDPSQAETFVHQWKCRKNGDNDPTITCQIRGKQ